MSKGKGLEGLFDGRHFDREIIVLCVRWYLRYQLSSGIELMHRIRKVSSTSALSGSKIPLRARFGMLSC
ncbi:hypothetical protein R75483_06470 [Paraburkholderia domus]|nr:hypothetical protein R75483_06470 [Paraburkholderia domus]